MLDQVREELELYQADWRNWLVSMKIGGEDMTATALGWKVADIEQFAGAVNELLPHVSQAHIADVNDRKIGSFVLYDELPLGLKVIKLMQRRSGSNDALGLDHVDITVPNLDTVEAYLKKMNVSHEWQSNDMHRWISARIINSREVKFVDHTVLDIGAKEMKLASKGLISRE